MDASKLERLAAAGIEVVPADIEKHLIVTREGFLALIEKRSGDFGRIGTAGLLTEKGLAPLMWREGEPWFVAKGHEQPASATEVEALRTFQRDLEAALA